MKVLIIKTSSMGDIIHTLPAVTDAVTNNPAIEFDWVVEEDFAEIPSWHPAVKEIIPIALRRWRKNIFSKKTREEWQTFRKKISAKKYDLVIDAQGLVKSAFLATLAYGERAGFDWRSAREGFASLLYHKKFVASWQEHAITRLRNLFAQAFNYQIKNSIPDYGINRQTLVNTESEPYLIFLHGTTWATKHWPEEYWISLGKMAQENNLQVKLFWGNENELQRAKRIAKDLNNIIVLPKLNLHEIAVELAGATAIAAVDTGLAHLSAALDVPTVSLYGPTSSQLNGALGKSQIHLSVNFSCAPCYERRCTFKENNINEPFSSAAKCFRSITPSEVWATLKTMVSNSQTRRT